MTFTSDRNLLLQWLKVLYVGLAVQIQNIGDGFFSPGPSSSDLTHKQVARHQQERAHMTMNEIKNAVFSANWQPGVPKYNWVNWQRAGFTNHNKHRDSGPDRTFSKENN